MKVIDPHHAETHFTYDAEDNLLELTDARGQKTEWEYDNRDRVVRTENALGQETLYAYDANDNLTQITQPDGGVISYQYDSEDRVIRKVGHQTVDYEYDPVLEVVKRINNGVSDLGFVYDQLGRLLTESENGDMMADLLLLFGLGCFAALAMTALELLGLGTGLDVGWGTTPPLRGTPPREGNLTERA